MKKLLLIALAAAAFTATDASAALTKTWEKTVASPFDDKGAIYNAPMAVDKDGNVIATGAFNKEITIGSTTLEYDFGTNAYLAKYDATGNVKWAVSLTGSVTLTALDTDAEGNIFVAGIFADELIANTTSGEALTGEGAKIGDAMAQNQNASFIAKYNADGKVLFLSCYAPETLEALKESFGYYPEDGDVFFRINNLQVVGDKLYASATYTGQTRKSDGKYLFEGSSMNLFGFMDSDSAAASVFSVSTTDLKDVTPVVRMGLTEPAIITETGQPMCKTVNFLVEDGKLYVAFGEMGPTTLSTAGSQKVLEKEFTAYTYTLAEIDLSTSAIAQWHAIDIQNNGEKFANNAFAGVFVKDANLYAIGYESIAIPAETPEGEATPGYDIFVFKAPKANLADAEMLIKSVIDGNVTYYGIKAAAQLADGSMVFNALGYYNTNVGDYKNGDFAGSLKTFSFDGTSFADWTLVPAATGIAAKGATAAFATVENTGITYAAYIDPSAGIDDVIVADLNAPVEYFNLQGIRVAEPASGLYIRRQGDKVSKVLIK